MTDSKPPNNRSNTVAMAAFVKTPGRSPVKTRLADGIGGIGGIGTDRAETFYRLSLSVVDRVMEQSPVDGYWAVAEPDAIDHPLWDHHASMHTGDGDLGLRQWRVYNRLLQSDDYDRVILTGGDIPQLSARRIQMAIDAMDHHPFVIGPADDGGYYLFGGSVKTNAATWENIDWGMDGVLQQLINQLPGPVHHLPELTDVDYADDLSRMMDQMPDDPNDAQRQLMAWVHAIDH